MENSDQQPTHPRKTKPPFRLVFIGATGFGFRCLQRVLQLQEIEVVSIISNPQTFSISYSPQGVKNVLHADFGSLARAHDIPIYLMQKNMHEPDLKAFVNACQPDFFMVVGWYHMIPKYLRMIGPALGIHASMLPAYSGGAPLVWAIINGLEQTGVTLFVMDDGIDDGPIVQQWPVTISPQDTIASLYQRVEEIVLADIKATLQSYFTRQQPLRIQDEALRTLMPQRSPEDGLIHWHHPAGKIYDFVRAQTRPYPGAFCWLEAEKVSVWSVGLLPGLKVAHQPGTIFCHEQGFAVACGQGSVVLLKDIQVGDETSHSNLLKPGVVFGASQERVAPLLKVQQ